MKAYHIDRFGSVGGIARRIANMARRRAVDSDAPF